VTNLLMVMPYLSYVAKARQEGFRVAAIWDPTMTVALPDGTRDFREYLDGVRELADEFVLTDFADTAVFERAVRDTARSFRADHVYHVGRESTMLMTYRIAEDLGLAVNPASSIEILNDKHAMRVALAEHGISPVRFALAEHWHDIPSLLGEFTLPVVVKPTTLAASRGVFLMHDAAELAGYGELLATYGYEGPVLVEEFLPGQEYTVETISSGGEHHVMGIGKKVMGPPPLFVDMGYLVPTPDSREVREVGDLVVDLLRVSGYRCGPANTEVIATPDGPRIVESQARLAGDNMPRMLQVATGFDLERGVFQALAGKPLGPNGRHDIARIGYFEFAHGRLRSVTGLAEASAPDHVVALSFPFEVGDELPAPKDSQTRHGYVIVTGATEAETEARLAQVRARISVTVE
jgi:biotin carboxylase